MAEQQINVPLPPLNDFLAAQLTTCIYLERVLRAIRNDPDEALDPERGREVVETFFELRQALSDQSPGE